MFRCPVLLFLFLTVYIWCQYWHVWSWPKYLTSQKHDTHKLALFTYLSILPIEEKANVCCTASDSVQRLHSAASSFQFISRCDFLWIAKKLLSFIICSTINMFQWGYWSVARSESRAFLSLWRVGKVMGEGWSLLSSLFLRSLII